jgi:hypothetical protein
MIRNQNFVWIVLAGICPIIFLSILTFVFHTPDHPTPVADLTAAHLKNLSNYRLLRVLNERNDAETVRWALRGSAK